MSKRTIKKITDDNGTRDNSTRFRRAGAWISEANKPLEPPARFVFSWIAFNAQYQDSRVRDHMQEDKKDSAEKVAINGFIDRISRSNGKLLVRAISKVELSMRKIFELQHVHPAFWKKPDGISTEQGWRDYFQAEKEKCRIQLNNALAVRPTEPAVNVAPALKSAFRRLRVVRNQVFHGGHSGAKNKSRGYTQIRHGAEVLFEMTKCFQLIMRERMKESPHEDWGKVDFPRQGKKPDDPNCLPHWLVEAE